MVAMLQDVWPDNAVQSRLITEGSILYKYFEMWQKSVYKNADKLICISDDMKDFIVSKGVDTDKIEVIYNWGYSDEVVDIPWEENEFVKKYNLSRDKFYAIYAGNIGKMQNVEIVVNAAKELQDREDIQFLIIGDGARREAIAEMSSGLKNLKMFPMQPSEMATHIYSAADVNIIPLVEGGTKTAMPSKTGIVLSCGKASIFTYGKESRFAELLKENNAGMSIDANDSRKMVECILSIMQGEVQSGAYQLFNQYFVRNSNIKNYIKVVSSLGFE